MRRYNRPAGEPPLKNAYEQPKIRDSRNLRHAVTFVASPALPAVARKRSSSRIEGRGTPDPSSKMGAASALSKMSDEALPAVGQIGQRDLSVTLGYRRSSKSTHLTQRYGLQEFLWRKRRHHRKERSWCWKKSSGPKLASFPSSMRGRFWRKAQGEFLVLSPENRSRNVSFRNGTTNGTEQSASEWLHLTAVSNHHRIQVFFFFYQWNQWKMDLLASFLGDPSDEDYY